MIWPAIPKELMDEIRHINSGDKISLTVAPQPTISADKEYTYTERKLSQAEIDVLVKKLLEEKNKS